MTFLNDMWKKFKAPPEAPSFENKPLSKNKTEAQTVLAAFEHNEVETLKMDSVINNLNILKALIDQPKEEKPELRFTTIKQHLGPPECHETIRKERWPQNINCPSCHSINLKRLAQLPPKSPHNHRYKCLDCGLEFSDDTDTPMERGIPPIHIWMQCWYLLGYGRVKKRECNPRA